MQVYVVLYDGDLIGVYSTDESLEDCKRELIYASGEGCWEDIEDDYIIRKVYIDDEDNSPWRPNS